MIQTVFGLNIEADLDLSDISCSGGDVAEVRIKISTGDSGLGLEIGTAIEILTPESAVWIKIGRCSGGYLLRFPDLADFIVTTDGRLVTCYPSAGTPMSTLRHLLLGQVLPRLSTLRGKPTLHGSAVALDSGVVAFLGHSGQGKSTIALALATSLGVPLLADDCLMFQIQDDGVFVQPCLIGPRLWPDTAEALLGDSGTFPTAAHYTNKIRVNEDHGRLVLGKSPAPLRRLFQLDPETESSVPIEISHLSVGRAFELLASYVLRLVPDERPALAAEFALLSELVAHVPVRRLRYRQGYEHLPDVISAVQRDVNGPTLGIG